MLFAVTRASPWRSYVLRLRGLHLCEGLEPGALAVAHHGRGDGGGLAAPTGRRVGRWAVCLFLKMGGSCRFFFFKNRISNFGVKGSRKESRWAMFWDLPQTKHT